MKHRELFGGVGRLRDDQVNVVPSPYHHGLMSRRMSRCRVQLQPVREIE